MIEQTDKAQRARERARERAASLFPLETWIEVSERVYLARSRRPWSKGQTQILEKELTQARVLATLGSEVYLLPERGGDGKHPDALVDGVFTEFKTITGGIREVERRFKEARRQAGRIFLKIDSDLTLEAVLRKLTDKVRKSHYSGGQVIVHLTATSKTYFWEVDHLK